MAGAKERHLPEKGSCCLSRHKSEGLVVVPVFFKFPFNIRAQQTRINSWLSNQAGAQLHQSYLTPLRLGFLCHKVDDIDLLK